VAAGRVRGARSSRRAAASETAEATPPEVDDETLDQLIAVRGRRDTHGLPARLRSLRDARAHWATQLRGLRHARFCWR
jgi:hypothetical protein